MENKYYSVIEKIASTDIFERRIDKIRKSGKDNTLIELSYVDKLKNRTKRLVEPYKLTDSDLWGYDIAKNSIRRFKLKGIRGVKTTKKSYIPRWDIEI